jgi:tetratricopeptide (TPR) repeat protein
LSRVTAEGTARTFVACVEAIAEAERLGDEANIGLERDSKTQRARLAAIEQAAEKWLHNAELRVALAEAYGDLGDLQRAIEHYEAARRGSDSQYKVKAIEQLANLTARHATISFRKSKLKARDLPAAIERIERARSLVETLVEALGPTSERLSIIGGCWKRLAQIDQDRTDESLDKMAKAYQRAADCRAGAKTDGATPILASYPPLMATAARLVAGLRVGQCPDDVRKALAAASKSVGIEDGEDFWQLIEATDVRMMAAMAAGSISEDDEGEMLHAYLKGWKHVGSPRMLMSVVEQLDFLEDTLKSGSPDSEPTRSAIVKAVTRIRAGLQQEADTWLPGGLTNE